MDAQSRSTVEPDLLSSFTISVDPYLFDESDVGFPEDLSSVTEHYLVQLCDGLFNELDSDVPDLRALERYLAVCDELALRQLDPETNDHAE